MNIKKVYVYYLAFLFVIFYFYNFAVIYCDDGSSVVELLQEALKRKKESPASIRWGYLIWIFGSLLIFSLSFLILQLNVSDFCRLRTVPVDYWDYLKAFFSIKVNYLSVPLYKVPMLVGGTAFTVAVGLLAYFTYIYTQPMDPVAAAVALMVDSRATSVVIDGDAIKLINTSLTWPASLQEKLEEEVIASKDIEKTNELLILICFVSAVTLFTYSYIL